MVFLLMAINVSTKVKKKKKENKDVYYIAQGILLSSLVMAYMTKESKKSRYMYMYNWVTLLCTEGNTTL